MAGERWFGIGNFVSWVFCLPVLKVRVLEMVEQEQLSHRLVSE